MSISLTFHNDTFSLNRLHLPSRYYYFNDVQNYIKLLSIGEGIFPKDKIRTNITLENSDAVFTTESATKVYPSQKELGINAIHLKLINSNLEFINDELILYKNARFLQLLKIKSDKNSTFFYGDILSHGRSFEDFSFHKMSGKNSFYINNKLEYLEKYTLEGEQLKTYIHRQNSKNRLFAKLYIKTNANGHFLDILNQNNLHSFSYTANRKILIGVLSGNNMSHLKKQLHFIWDLYRVSLEKNKFNLGKQ